MPHALTYDTLPPHSTLRREVHEAVIKIIAAAEEPPEATRALVRRKTALPAALLAAALMLTFVAALAWTFLGNRRNIGVGLMIVLAIAFAVFCGALFLFVWRNAYASQLDAIAQARRQTTILAVAPNRIWMETTGPFGTSGREIDSLVELRLAQFRPLPAVQCVELQTAASDRIQVFPGRDREELLWLCRTIRNFLAAAPPDRTIP